MLGTPGTRVRHIYTEQVGTVVERDGKHVGVTFDGDPDHVVYVLRRELARPYC